MVKMSQKELNRLSIMEQLRAKQITQKEAGKLLGLKVRQIKRLWRNFKLYGAKGLISKKRGRPSNHQLPVGLKEQAISIVRTYYADFGPTLASEYLLSEHGIRLSVETLRQAMIEAGLWQPKQKKAVRVHQQRPRRACFGELVQLDGSPHDWFEDRAPRCCLLVLIDDATSAILGLHFLPSETTQGYFKLVGEYFKRYGLPMSFYSDRHSIFQTNNANHKLPEATQFERAMNELGVELILASTPQAKGRVEKANRTLQDRLVKALRLKKINSIEEANDFLPEFIDAYNEKFAKLPASHDNAHCPLNLSDDAIDKILSYQTVRKLSKALECSYHTTIYQVIAPKRKYQLQNKPVLICENHEGKVTLFHHNESLEFKTLKTRTKAAEVVDDKALNAKVDRLLKKQKKPYKTPQNHPWKKFVINPKKQIQNQDARR